MQIFVFSFAAFNICYTLTLFFAIVIDALTDVVVKTMRVFVH